MNRRGFLTALAGLAAGATLDPERLLWVPGRKLISIPHPFSNHDYTFTAAEIVKGAFHKDCFALVSKPFNAAEFERAFGDFNRMIDRWNEDGWTQIIPTTDSAGLPATTWLPSSGPGRIA